MKILLLLALSAGGIWYNFRATRHWWALQKQHLPEASDIAGWANLAFSGVWYAFLFVFFAGLTLNNTLFR
ncbi:MAG: hypothetical protein H6686_00525 [Fibrobacteria bacterium]|nr:hypothetical protein [Fibrobacteria bacterium]